MQYYRKKIMTYLHALFAFSWSYFIGHYAHNSIVNFHYMVGMNNQRRRICKYYLSIFRNYKSESLDVKSVGK